MPFKETYWKSRLIHINVNSLVASAISILIASHFVYLTRYITDHTFAIALISYGIDGLIDFCIFALLHSLMYTSRIGHLPHAKLIAYDLALIQSHRLALSVLTLGTSVLAHWALMHFGLGRTMAFIIAYSLGVLIVRAAHTWYGLRTGLFEPLRFAKKPRR